MVPLHFLIKVSNAGCPCCLLRLSPAAVNNGGTNNVAFLAMSFVSCAAFSAYQHSGLIKRKQLGLPRPPRQPTTGRLTPALEPGAI